MSPDDREELGPIRENQTSRMAERLAALEARSVVEIAGLKKDTESLRSMGHDLNNQIQKFVAIVLPLQSTIAQHLEACDRRGSRLERLAIAGVTIGVTTCGAIVLAFINHFWR